MRTPFSGPPSPNGKVSAFMSVNHSDPDVAAEIFVMDRPVLDAAGEPAA
jgi:hypothetical protein